MKLTIRGIFDDIYGPEKSGPEWLFGDLTQPKTMPPARRDGHAFSSGPDNNASTPRDMTRLLALIYRGKVVDRAACDGMLYIMLQQQLNARLPRYLPFGIPFAHKTGTLAGVRNDAGVLYVNEQNHVAITVFCKWDAEAVKEDKVAEWEQTERIDSAFGQIGRAIFDHFGF
jgi:beta-lactamase class A